jgi:hypothetical protein
MPAAIYRTVFTFGWYVHVDSSVQHPSELLLKRLSSGTRWFRLHIAWLGLLLVRGRPQLNSTKMSTAAVKRAEMDHPPYNDMIAEAIATLADRGGSSLIAIKKHIGAKYKLKEGWERKVCRGALNKSVQCCFLLKKGTCWAVVNDLPGR